VIKKIHEASQAGVDGRGLRSRFGSAGDRRPVVYHTPNPTGHSMGLLGNNELMIANVIWLYDVPFAIFQRAFPFFVIFVILCEAAILTAGRIPLRRSLVCSIAANVSSYVVGFLLVSLSRGTLLPRSSESFMLQSHLWRGFVIAFILSVLTEGLVYRWMIRDCRFRKIILLVLAANFASYATTIAVNWDLISNVTRQMRWIPTKSSIPDDQDLPKVPIQSN
jgi:hypothetical protein